MFGDNIDLPIHTHVCMCLGDENVAAVHVASVHVNVHVLRAINVVYVHDHV
jgi:hypothetical protein